MPAGALRPSPSSPAAQPDRRPTAPQPAPAALPNRGLAAALSDPRAAALVSDPAAASTALSDPAATALPCAQRSAAALPRACARSLPCTATRLPGAASMPELARLSTRPRADCKGSLINLRAASRRATALALASLLALAARPGRADDAPPAEPHRSLQFDAPRSALEEGFARSLESKAPATIQFVNLTGKELQLFWLDFHGQRRAYGKIPAGGQVTHSTFLTHPWLVATAHGHGLAIFRAHGKSSTVLIDPMAAPKLAQDAAAVRSTSGAATSLRFVNPTAQPVELDWIDYQGKRQKRALVAPHSELIQETYVNHAWVVANQDGKAQAIFIAKATPQTAVIAPDALDVP